MNERVALALQALASVEGLRFTYTPFTGALVEQADGPDVFIPVLALESQGAGLIGAVEEVDNE